MKLLPYLMVFLLLFTLATIQLRGNPETPPTPTFGFTLIDKNGREINLRTLPSESTQLNVTPMPPIATTPECPPNHIYNPSTAGPPCLTISPTAINPPPHP